MRPRTESHVSWSKSTEKSTVSGQKDPMETNRGEKQPFSQRDLYLYTYAVYIYMYTVYIKRFDGPQWDLMGH